MALMNVNDLLKEFDEVISKIREGTQLTTANKDHLSEVYNYLSKTIRQTSLTNVLHNKSAQVSRVEKLLDQERTILEKHQKFVENNFDKAEQHFRAIQFGGYAVFFAIWGFTKELIDPIWGSIAALSMVISAIIFVVWEVFKSLTFGYALKDHAKVGMKSVEKFISSRMSVLLKDYTPVVFFQNLVLHLLLVPFHQLLLQQ
jgi:hypothetical protein